LLRRFRSDDDVQHRGAFFELFLHELLLRFGATLEIHPEVPGTNKRPEFRVSSEGVQFYIEAKVANDESKAEAAARKRTNLVYDALNDLDSPDYWINVDVRGAPDSLVPTSKLKQFLARRLAELDYDEVVRRYEASGLDDLPRWPYEFEGWSVEFFPLPKQSARGQQGVRPMGVQMSGAMWIEPATAVREAILEKAKRYGSPDLPYVIAVNAVGEFISDDHVLEALFGDEVFVSRFEGDPFQMQRKPNGVWTGQGGHYTRVSACLIFQKLHSWNFPSASVRLFHNPWAARNLQGPLLTLPQANVVNDHLEHKDGLSLAQVFDLAPDCLRNLDD
jgi:hypothetical protein